MRFTMSNKIWSRCIGNKSDKCRWYRILFEIKLTGRFDENFRDWHRAIQDDLFSKIFKFSPLCNCIFAPSEFIYLLQSELCSPRQPNSKTTLPSPSPIFAQRLKMRVASMLRRLSIRSCSRSLLWNRQICVVSWNSFLISSLNRGWRNFPSYASLPTVSWNSFTSKFAEIIDCRGRGGVSQTLKERSCNCCKPFLPHLTEEIVLSVKKRVTGDSIRDPCSVSNISEPHF